MGKPRRFKTPNDLLRAWDAYKADCDNQDVLTHEFSQKMGTFVSERLHKAVTYTIEGFCVFAGLARRAFYDTYDNDPRYAHIVTRIREECEVDARRKFETGQIPSQLAALWMSKHGYSAKTDNAVSGSVALANSPYDELSVDELRKLARITEDEAES